MPTDGAPRVFRCDKCQAELDASDGGKKENWLSGRTNSFCDMGIWAVFFGVSFAIGFGVSRAV